MYLYAINPLAGIMESGQLQLSKLSKEEFEREAVTAKILEVRATSSVFTEFCSKLEPLGARLMFVTDKQLRESDPFLAVVRDEHGDWQYFKAAWIPVHAAAAAANLG